MYWENTRLFYTMLSELETQFSFENSNKVKLIEHLGIKSDQLCLFDGHVLKFDDDKEVDISNRIALTLFN